MSDIDIMIRAEGLGKKYRISHKSGGEPYTALRDVLARRGRNLLRAVSSAKRGQPTPALHQYEEFWALRDIDCEIRRGEVVGIIGRNGAGKSTLLKVLSRITEPSAGRVTLRGRVASLLEVGTGFHPELSGCENIFLNGAILGMSHAEIKRKFDEIVAFAEVERFLDTPVKRYSSGMYVRLAFAVAAHLEPEILIVDEVLAVGDAEFQKKCLGKMNDVASDGRTVLFVSHNMGTIGNLCERCILLDRGKLVAQASTQEIIERYETESLALFDRTGLPKGVLYAREPEDAERFAITGVRMTDAEGKPIAQVRSLSDVTLNIRFHSPKAQRNGSVALFIKSLNGITMLRCATRPDSSFDMDFKLGSNEVRCRIEKLPLPPGEYILGVGLAIPMKEWLHLKAELCTFEVVFNDAHKSGFVPRREHAEALAAYRWEY